MAHTLQERYASLVDAKLRQVLVTKNNVIFNNRYEGNPVAGAVKIPVRGDMTSAAYNKETGKALSIGDTKYITLTMKDIAVNELIDGYDAAGVPDNLVADRLDSAGYALGLTEDMEGLKALVMALEGKDAEGVAYASNDPRYGKAGTSTAITLTKANVFDEIVELGVALDTAGVPNEGRFLIVSPEVYALILTSDSFVKKGDLAQEIVMTGAVGEIAGFIVYKSANMGSTSAGKGVQAIASHPNFCHRVEEWSVSPKVEDIKDGVHIGASAVQGRKVYNHCVSKPQAVAGLIKE